ncbi:EamA family transporter [Tuwongella immobilis]|uniref:EamA domain-containing protein n=1 Tax=Tuwongella immobilis TaxID=692036 RepID=A0A6C2YLW1_9BACT|nr:EamA family transporter [Tuwongella immobilis]VIP02570.1 multidrug transporter : Uncharacterized protein OS=Chthoniobacter flavus Ellin428 GN=CfE428DRAFT_3859 PE=4 SV=1: EamA: EamA [Tuwongella immobilis]VTS01799.1 multidrug transporter : Uncharacterized protein OS=Chthoniobacter flavus Ellin428 GN=CfE428DRAFT_3859 PE=4 SV=1: EamA: EamA [Tuwongella immobilis]
MSRSSPDVDGYADEPTSNLLATPKLLTIVLAFLAVYLTWSSTYLAMLWATESMPVFLMAGSRFVIAGGLMYLLVRLQGHAAPTWRQMRLIAISGFLLMLIGNAGVVWAEANHLPTSLASLLVALTPMATAAIDWLIFRAERPRGLVLLGLILGMVGMAVLLAPSLMELVTGAETEIPIWGVISVIVAVVAWSLGALMARYAQQPASTWVTASMQMLIGGMQLLVVSVLLGETAQWNPIETSLRGWLSFGYLIVFGSWVGYSAFTWLMKHVNPTLVATYGFVNPVLAVMIGWFVLGEQLSTTALGGGGIILMSVLLILIGHARKTQRAARTRARLAIPSRLSAISALAAGEKSS